MKNKSIWLEEVKNKNSQTLKKDIETDVLIIGGGITGMTTAYFLKDSNLKIALVDQGKIAHGQSAHTTGKLTYLQGLLLEKIEKTYDQETALQYLFSQKEAIEVVKDIIVQNNIKCNFESNNSYLFTSKNAYYSKLGSIENLLQKANIKYKIVKKLPISYPCKYAIKIDDSAVFHPIKYLFAIQDILLKHEISIYENTKIISLEKKKYGYLASSDEYKIKAKKVILACHYPFFIKPYFFPFKTSLKKGYLCAGTVNKNKRFNAISEDCTVHSIRYHSDTADYMIYAGEERNLGNNMDNEKNYENLFWQMKTHLNDHIKYYWFNYDVVTNDSLPIIGYVEPENKNLLIGTGYNLWGMTNGTIAGKILSDLVMNKQNAYQELFDPNRSFNINKLVNYLSYNLMNGYHFVLSKINKSPNFYTNVEIREKDGKTYGVYIDEEKQEHIVSNICPHMKCSLIFNTVDKTWDCPCHGSRFNIDGKVIKGPSTYDISVVKEKK